MRLWSQSYKCSSHVLAVHRHQLFLLRWERTGTFRVACYVRSQPIHTALCCLRWRTPIHRPRSNLLVEQASRFSNLDRIWAFLNLYLSCFIRGIVASMHRLIESLWRRLADIIQSWFPIQEMLRGVWMIPPPVARRAGRAAAPPRGRSGPRGGVRAAPSWIRLPWRLCVGAAAGR